MALAMFRFATSGNFTSNFAGENAGLIARALSSFKGRIKEHLQVVVNTENMKSVSALDHRRMEYTMRQIKANHKDTIVKTKQR